MKVKTCANGSNVAKRVWSFDHRIDFDNSCVIDKSSFRIKKNFGGLANLCTKHAARADNSEKIPNQYSIRFKN